MLEENSVICTFNQLFDFNNPVLKPEVGAAVMSGELPPSKTGK
jgi:hypothetical protein